MAKMKKIQAGNFPSALSAEKLKGKQSVRATFKLPNQVIDLLGIVASQLGLKQKSLFDQLLDDEKTLIRIAEEAVDHTLDKKDYRQKTFVISKSSLQVLDRVAEKNHIPRDVLVENSINRLIPIISSEQKRHDKRKIIYADLLKYLNQGKRILAKAHNLLGTEDQISIRLTELVNLCDKSLSELGKTVEKGKRMDSL